MPKIKSLPKLPHVDEVALQIKKIHDSSDTLILPHDYKRPNVKRLSDVESFIRRGERVYRTIGKAGADLDRPPVAAATARLEQAYETDINKAMRTMRLILGGRDARLEAVKKLSLENGDVNLKVMALTEAKSRDSNLASKIAKKLNITSSYVRKIWKKAGLHEKAVLKS